MLFTIYYSLLLFQTTIPKNFQRIIENTFSNTSKSIRESVSNYCLKLLFERYLIVICNILVSYYSKQLFQKTFKKLLKILFPIRRKIFQVLFERYLIVIYNILVSYYSKQLFQKIFKELLKILFRKVFEREKCLL